MDSFDKVREIIVNSLGCDEEAVTRSADVRDDLGADSLDIVELIMSLESEFGISVPMEQTESLKTVGEIAALVDSLK